MWLILLGSEHTVSNQQAATLTTLLNQINYMRDAVDPDMTGLAMGMFFMVAAAPHSEGVPMSRVIERMNMSASTCSRNIYLMSSGFVRNNDPRKGFGILRTETTPGDRRSLTVYLTPKGVQVAKGLAQVK